ncbi:MAG: YdhR family protein [Chloroflexota bacterium]
MTQKILQINFMITSSVKDYVTLVAPFADPIAKVPGLEWKVWLFNEQKHEAGGVYLFRDEASVNAYLNGDIVAGLKKQPTIKEISAKVFDVEESLTRTTRGPLKTAVAA